MTTRSASRLVCLAAGLIGQTGAALATPPPIMTPPSAAAPAMDHGTPGSMAGGSVDPNSMDAAKVGDLPDAPAGSVVLQGLGGRRETLTASDVAKRPHDQVSVERDGKTLIYAGPALDDLLRDVGTPFGARIHGQGVNDVLFVVGRDRYRVVLTLPEVDASFHKGAHAILADQMNGRPLDAHDGPFRLVIDGDLKPSRLVHNVVLIEVKHLP